MAKKEIEQFDDEIDLFELMESLWKEKVLIVAITAVIPTQCISSSQRNY